MIFATNGMFTVQRLTTCTCYRETGGSPYTLYNVHISHGSETLWNLLVDASTFYTLRVGQQIRLLGETLT